MLIPACSLFLQGLADDLDKLDNRQLCNLMFRRNGEEHSAPGLNREHSFEFVSGSRLAFHAVKSVKVPLNQAFVVQQMPYLKQPFRPELCR